MSLFVCHDLKLGYGDRAVSDGICFTVEAGDYLCVVGENGSGKSTLVRVLLRLAEPKGGTITLGEGLTRDEIGYLPQQSGGQNDFPASVREIVLSGCLNRCGFRPFYNKAEKDLSDLCLRRMNLEGLGDRCFRELSGGQQRRVLLARSLCAARRVLFLDEPTAGLDPASTKEMYGLIGKLNREDGLTIVMVSHDVRMAVRHSKHILHMGSHPKFFGTAEAYSRCPLCHAFLEEEEDPS